MTNSLPLVLVVSFVVVFVVFLAIVVAEAVVVVAVVGVAVDHPVEAVMVVLLFDIMYAYTYWIILNSTLIPTQNVPITINLDIKI